MKVFYYFIVITSLLVFNQCNTEPKSVNGNILSPSDFYQKIIEQPAAPIIDVRNSSEFSKAHLQSAVNIDINGGHFDDIISKLDKSKPVLLYCLSGARSSTAASHMRAMGFREVYELEGGLMKWRTAGLPLLTNTSTTPSATTTGMTKADFESKLTSEKLVLVDFYASWCAPCRKMKPFIEEIASEMSDKVEVLTIDADDQPELCKVLDVSSLPTLLLYKNKTLIWENRGYIEKADILKALQ